MNRLHAAASTAIDATTLRRYDEKLINLQDKPQWYLDIVPTTLVPAIEWHDENWKAVTPGSGELVWELSLIHI